MHSVPQDDSRIVKEFVSSPIMSFPLAPKVARHDCPVADTEPDFANQHSVFNHANMFDGFHITFLDIDTAEEGHVDRAEITIYGYGWGNSAPRVLRRSRLL